MRPPIFYPNKRLKSQDLIDFEDYLLSPWKILSDHHGVIFIEAPVYSKPSSGRCFSVKKIQGITPEGTPVIIDENEGLTYKDATFKSEMATADFYITNKHSENIGLSQVVSDDNPDYYKYQIVIESVNTLAKRVELKEDSLYLGRYRYGGSADLEAVQPPYFYNLDAAINFKGDTEWRTWTEPIRNRLKTLLKEYGANQLITYKLTELVFNYRRWPVKELIKYCNELSELKNYNDIGLLLEKNAALVSRSNTVLQSKLKTDYEPNDLPTFISERLIRIDDPSGWTLIFSDKDYEIKNNIVTFLRGFEEETAFRFAYTEPVKTTILRITNKHKLLPHKFTAKAGAEIFMNDDESPTLTFEYKLTDQLEPLWKVEMVGLLQSPVLIQYKALNKTE